MNVSSIVLFPRFQALRSNPFSRCFGFRFADCVGLLCFVVLSGVVFTLKGVWTARSRKEVFQPHLPVRLPCYDLAPVTSFALGGVLRRLQAPAAPMA